MGRSYRIAFKARLYRLLSERPEYLTASRADVIERMLDAQVAIGEFDRTLILHASEADRLCGHAVYGLSRRAPLGVLDVLSILDPDRLVAMYYALPLSRRASVRRDAAWAYHVERAPEDIQTVVTEVAGWAKDIQRITTGLADLAAQAPNEARKDTERFDRTMLRHEVGLPVLLTDAEHELIAQAEDTDLHSVLSVFSDELAQLGAEPDTEAFASACARAVERCSDV
jgi:hypothetical protein